MADFKLPDLGEGVTEAEIDKWLVNEGDVISEDAPLVQVITDKATAEIPSPFEGRVSQIHVAPGQVVPVGTVLVTIESDAVAEAPVAHEDAAPAETFATDVDESPAPAESARDGGGNGAGVKATPPVRRLARELGVDLSDVRGTGPGRRITREDVEAAARAAEERAAHPPPAIPDVPPPPPAAAEAPVPADLMDEGPAADVGAALDEGEAPDAPTPAADEEPVAPEPVAAEESVAPEPVAGEGQDVPPPPPPLESVSTRDPSEPGDLAAAVPAPPPPEADEQSQPAAEEGVEPAAVAEAPERGSSGHEEPAQVVPDAPVPAAEGAVAAQPPVAATAPATDATARRESLRGIRRTIAQRMSHAHVTIPPVTHVEECDVTELDETRRLANERSPEGARLTFLPFIVTAVVAGLKEFPALNASLDEDAGEIVYHGRYDIGVAVDTLGGLMVPVVRGADSKTLVELAEDIERLATEAREGTLLMEELRGPTFTITSPGPYGGLMATPIVFHPQTGILGVHRATDRPVVRDGQIVIRKMMNLSITFDHRVLDGLTAAKFALHVVELLEHPAVGTIET